MSDLKAATVHLDRAALAVLAHPLRSRLLAELRVSGPATATTLAAVLVCSTAANVVAVAGPLTRSSASRRERNGWASTARAARSRWTVAALRSLMYAH